MFHARRLQVSKQNCPDLLHLQWTAHQLVHVYVPESHLTDCYCVLWWRAKDLRRSYLPFKVFFLKFRQNALYSHKTLRRKMFCQYCSFCNLLYASQCTKRYPLMTVDNKNAPADHKNVSGNVAVTQTARALTGSFDHYGSSACVFFCHVLPESAIMVSLFKRVPYTAHTVASIVACSRAHSPLPYYINIRAWVRTLTFKTEQWSRDKQVPRSQTKNRFSRVFKLFISSYTCLIQVIRRWRPLKSPWLTTDYTFMCLL